MLAYSIVSAPPESLRTGKKTEEPMDTISLNVTKRQVLGKKTKALRRAGVTPAHVFGHGVKSQPLQGNTTEIEGALSRAGTSSLISLGIEGEKRHRSVLVREVQREPVTDLLVHVDFYQVRSKEKMSVEVPVHLVGDAPALVSTANTLDIEMPTLHVECLPANLPSQIDIDVSGLKDTNDAIRVSDVALPQGVSALNSPELVVVKVEPVRGVRIEEEEAEAAEEAAAEEIPEAQEVAGESIEKREEE